MIKRREQRLLRLIEKQLPDVSSTTQESVLRNMRCLHCVYEGTCSYAGAIYNTGGDCLAEK